MANFDQVFALKPFKTMWRIRVKIIWVWKQYSTLAGESIEMVLVDSSVSHVITFCNARSDIIIYGFKILFDIFNFLHTHTYMYIEVNTYIIKYSLQVRMLNL